MAEFLSEAKRDRLRKGELAGSSKSDQEMFFEACERLRLDPEARQVFPVKRGGKLGIGTTIDGFRLVAERSGKYAGQDGPYFCGKDGEWRDVWLDAKPPHAAKVGVLRSDFGQPLYAVALWSSYYEGSRNPIAQKMPDVMLAKCAEALALRKAFPNDLSGVYTSEEMEQAGEQAPLPPVPSHKAQFLDNDWPVDTVWTVAKSEQVGMARAEKLHTLLHKKGLDWSVVQADFKAKDGRLLPDELAELPQAAVKDVAAIIGKYKDAKDVPLDDMTPEERAKAEELVGAMKGGAKKVTGRRPEKGGDE